jgi:hypothetical protein
MCTAALNREQLRRQWQRENWMHPDQLLSTVYEALTKTTPQ